MTNIQGSFDPQVQHQQDAPQEQPLRGIRTGQAALLLALLAATGTAWWTMQDRGEFIASEATPSLASTAPLPVPVDEAPVATEATPARVAPAAKVMPARSRDRAPTLIAGSQVIPKYPAAALRSGEAGTVLVAATIDASGVPVDVSIDDRSGNRELDRSALQAVRQWRFQPALRDGKPVTATIRVPVEFALQNS